MPHKIFSQQKNENYFKKIHHHFFNNLSEIDTIIQEQEEILKKNPRQGLTEVSKLIDSVVSKRQGDRRKHSFLERKKILHEREWIHYELLT